MFRVVLVGYRSRVLQAQGVSWHCHRAVGAAVVDMLHARLPACFVQYEIEISFLIKEVDQQVTLCTTRRMDGDETGARRRAWSDALTEAQGLAAKAIKRERQGDLAAAYSLCIKTAQAYLSLLRSASSDHDRQTLKAASSRVLARAEKIKAVKRDARPAPVNRLDERTQMYPIPRGCSALRLAQTVEQDSVLYASSLIQSHRFPPWSDSITHSLADKANFMCVHAVPIFPQHT